MIYIDPLRWSGAVPKTEFAHSFLQGMLDRMGMSYFKYGAVATAFPNKVNAVDTLKTKLNQYLTTGNKEYLMDVANYAMIEFMHPRHPQAHFRPTDSNESQGRIWIGEIIPVQDKNIPEKEK